MSERRSLLPLALTIFGYLFCLLYVMQVIWPTGWKWHEGSPASSDYFMMIAGVYFVLGIFMIRAAKNPTANLSLIWFVFWSNLAHAAVMAWESFRTPMAMGHLVGDVPALLFISSVLGVLTVREQKALATIRS